MEMDDLEVGSIVNQEILQAALRPRGQRAKAHRVGEDVFCVLVEGLLLALSDKTSSQYFRRKGVALEGEFDGISYFDELGEEHIVEGCHLRGVAFLIYARAACFIRYFLILSFPNIFHLQRPLTRFPSRDKYSPWRRSSILAFCL